MTIAGPSTVTSASPHTVALSWFGLSAGQKYLGSIQYLVGTTNHARTLVRIDP